MLIRENRKNVSKRGNEAIIDTDLIRQLRTKLLVSELEPKVIAITSSEAGEGKTTIAINLANSFISIGKKAIFVDGVLREVYDTNKFGVYSTLGLSNFLEGSHQLNELVVKQLTGGADLILNVKSSLNSTDLLEGDCFIQLIEKLRTEYDFVILDTPDMSSCPDAVVISKFADAVVHVVEANRLSGVKAQKDITFLEETKTKVIGIVLNKTEI